jgi:hypothetical protein
MELIVMDVIEALKVLKNSFGEESYLYLEAGGTYFRLNTFNQLYEYTKDGSICLSYPWKLFEKGNTPMLLDKEPYIPFIEFRRELIQEEINPTNYNNISLVKLEFKDKGILTAFQLEDKDEWDSNWLIVSKELKDYLDKVFMVFKKYEDYKEQEPFVEYWNILSHLQNLYKTIN